MNRTRHLTRSTRAQAEEPPVLPDRPSDEQERGWHEPRPDERDRDWYERERPPHHE